MDSLRIDDIAVIAENDLGYRFGVGRVGDRWIGFATESEGIDVDPGMLFIIPEICDGFEMGILDRDRCVLLTGAIAQDPEYGFGGVERWHVPEHLRGKPEDFRCANCDRVGCTMVDCQDVYDGEREWP